MRFLLCAKGHLRHLISRLSRLPGENTEAQVQIQSVQPVWTERDEDTWRELRKWMFEVLNFQPETVCCNEECDLCEEDGIV